MPIMNDGRADEDDSDARVTATAADGNDFGEPQADWRQSPVFIGSTKFEPLPDVRNIMITGGAGFMYG